MMEWSIIIPILSVAGLWLGFLEKRLADMKSNIEVRMNEKNELNRVVQANLAQDIARLETKIDMLIQLQINKKSPEARIND